jgi:Ca-activated chloride channel family protein
MTSFVYGALDTQEPLIASQVYEAEEAMRALEEVTSKYGRSSRALLELMASEGPGYLHAAAVPEANVARFNAERSDELRFPLAFIIPAGGTIWANHPYCILDNAEWVESEEAEAAAIFRDYLLAREQQELAIDHYIRPADITIALHPPLNLENGVDPRVSLETVPALPSPDSDISAAVQDLFTITKRKATVVIALDISGSMGGEKIRAATRASAEFLDRLHPEDKVVVLTFDNDVTMLDRLQLVGNNVEELSAEVISLNSGGGTALYDAVCRATRLATQQKIEDQTNDEPRLYGIVLLSDGKDTGSQLTGNQMFMDCLPETAEAEGFKIFPIAFGNGANKDVLQRIAGVTGGRLFEADSDTISDVYLAITAEQ